MTRDALVRVALRTVAGAIAVAALIDPVMTRSRPAPERVVVARLASADVAAIGDAIRQALPRAEISVRDLASGRLPCAPGESCVMVADGSIAADVPDDVSGPVSLIRLPLPAGANLTMQSAIAQATQSTAGSGMVRVTVSGIGMKGRRSELRITDGAATVGSLVHDWTADGEVTLEVPWWPLGDGPRALRVAAAPFDGEASALDNAIEVGATVSSARARVLVFDVRPSWASTFVRRALEDDPRFQVEHRVGLAPALTAGTGAVRLDAVTLDAVPVVVVGGPDSLGAGDVTLLERFARERGGTLILMPDRNISGTAARLVRGRWTEHLEAAAGPAGPLRASETLRLAEASPFDQVLGSVQGRPVIVVSPSGHGRIVMSGAMDAWRYRDTDGGAFDRFWRSLALESAAAGSALRMELPRPIAAPGARVPVVVRNRRMSGMPAVTVAASASCGDGSSESVRLRPAAEAGVFSGDLAMPAAGSCEVRVTTGGGVTAIGGVTVTTGATASVAAVLAKLERVAARSGGVAGDTDTVVASLVTAPSTDTPAPAWPMRSPWWMSPFVACLGVEWWLRRRAGLR